MKQRKWQVALPAIDTALGYLEFCHILITSFCPCLDKA
jgi:hypothetical protein